MRKIFIYLPLVILTFCSLKSNSQTVFDPSVVVLIPNETEADKSTEKEITEFNKIIHKQIENRAIREEDLKTQQQGQPENIGIMTQSAFEFSKKIDFYSMISSITEQFLQYSFFENFPNLLVLAKHEKSDGFPTSLTSIAEKYNTQFVINLKKVKTFKSNESKTLELDIQIFDRVSNSTILDRKYTGEETNPGFEFACENGTISCCANNAIKSFVYDAMRVIAENSPTLKLKRQIEKDRNSVLINNYYPKTPNNFILPKILDSDNSINKQTFYQGFMNKGNDKFIAFFAENSTGKDLKEFNDKYGDKNITMGEDFFTNPPNMYCFIVYGIKYNDKWYYKKDEIVHFKSTDFEQGKLEYFVNLKNWNFFEKNSNKESDEFWETNFFTKIQDLTKDPDWENYGETIWKYEEEENRDYIGQYKLIADQLKNEKLAFIEKNRVKTEDEITLENHKTYRDKLKSEIFLPLFEELKLQDSIIYNQYNLHNKYLTLIFPSDNSTVLCIISFTNSSNISYLKYFVINTENNNEVYLWTYFKETPLEQSDFYGEEIVGNMNKITKWDYSYKTLDDKNFWEKYIFLKNGVNYKYLKKIK